MSKRNSKNHILHPYHEHRTRDEGSQHKVHLIADDMNKSLCGFDHHCFGYSPTIVDLDWIDQPDNGELCQKCREIARNNYL